MHSAEELAELADIDEEVVEEAFAAADRLIPTVEREDTAMKQFAEMDKDKQEEFLSKFDDEARKELRARLEQWEE